MNNVLFFFFTAKWDQCMQVLLAGTAARVPTSSSDGKRKTKKKKMVKSPNWVLSHFLLGWFHRSRAASAQVTAALWLQGSADNAQPFQWHGRGKKKDVWHQPCTLYFNTMWCTTVRRKEKKNKQNESKSQISSVSLRVCFNFVLHVEGRQAQFLFLLLLLFKHSLKRESSLTQVAPRLPLKRAACDDGQPTGLLFFGKREEDRQTDRQTCAEAIVPSFLPYSAKLTN